jgi:NAD-dependent deacetylase
MDGIKIEQLKQLINKSENIVFLGGAGTSTESDIPDFRSGNGLYSKGSKYNVPPEEILSIGFFNRQTADFYSYYRENLIYPDAKPNSTHFALAKLEKRGKLKAIITQNIDGLHQMAGSTNVIEIHGSLHRSYCQNCGRTFSLEYVLESDGVPFCDKCQSIVRPDVVMYGEQLNEVLLSESIDRIGQADLLIVGGTSLVVYPVAGLIRYFHGHDIVIINKTETRYDNMATMRFEGPIGEVLLKAVLSDE